MADPFDGLRYPSIAMYGNGDNLALRPRFADSSLKPSACYKVQIDDVDASSFSFHEIERGEIR